jgi:Fe-S-cluster containining protein
MRDSEVPESRIRRLGRSLAFPLCRPPTDAFPMRSIRIAIVGPSPCGRCTAQCCRQTVSDFAVLLQGTDERRRFAAWSIELSVRDHLGTTTLERVIPYRDGACPFLDTVDNRCTIYADRPRACRDFECTRHYHEPTHGYFVERNATVRSMLQAW